MKKEIEATMEGIHQMFREARQTTTTILRLVQIVKDLKPDFMFTTKGSDKYNAIYSTFLIACTHRNTITEITKIVNVDEITKIMAKVKQRKATAQ